MTDFPQQYAESRRFTLGAPRNVRVSPDGSIVLFLRSTGPTDPVLALWVLNVSTGETTMLVDPKRLTGNDADLPAAELARRERARESASGIVTYTLDAEANAAVFVLGGDCYAVDIASAALTPIPTSGNVFDPVIDPTGRFIAFVADPAGGAARDEGDQCDDTTSGGGLFVAARSGQQQPVLVASDPDPLVSWGRAEFVAAEEMGRTRGFWWSPDGASLLVQRTDDHDVPVWWITDPAHPDRTPRPIRYPAAGATNATVELYRFTIGDHGNGLVVEGGNPIDWSQNSDASPSFEYLNDVVWRKDHPPLIVRQTRDQRTIDISMLSDTNELESLRTITEPIWVELIPGAPAWCGDHLLTVEDLDGARRLCADGVPVTPDGVQVRSIVRVDGNVVTVTASLDDPTSVHVLDIVLAAEPGPPRSIDQRTKAPGVHSVAAGETTTVVTAQRASRHGVEIQVTADSGVMLIDDLSAVPVISAEPRFLTVGERSLRSALFLPRGHDGATSLPVLLDPYGGPHAQRVLQTHNAHLVSQWFADQGYAVLVTDGRGTPGRGPEFERAVWGDLAAPVLEDQIDALDAVAAQYQFLDLDRVGIRGWSFGGYLAALAVLRRPDRVHAAIAGAPVTDWRLYDTHYTERYLGRPDTHAEYYQRCDLTSDAALLTRPLLLIHGLADDNVVAAHTLQLSSALLAAGRTHQVLPLSGVTHMTPQEVVAENLLRLQLEFLDDQLHSRSEKD